MIGPWEIRREAGRTVHRVECDSGFRAITTRDGIIESALLITDRSGDRRVRKLIAQKAKVEGKLDLVFNPEAKPEDFQ